MYTFSRISHPYVLCLMPNDDRILALALSAIFISLMLSVKMRFSKDQILICRSWKVNHPCMYVMRNRHTHVFSDDLIIRRQDGKSNKSGNPFEPMKLKAAQLVPLAQHLQECKVEADSTLQKPWTMEVVTSLLRVRDHYAEYAWMVCTEKAHPHAHYSIGDLLLRPEDNRSMATIGGVGIPYMLVSQKQVLLPSIRLYVPPTTTFTFATVSPVQCIRMCEGCR